MITGIAIICEYTLRPVDICNFVLSSIFTRLAVNIAKTTAINFCRIYQRDTIYPSFSLPRSYPHFFEERFACDYLNNTIKT